MYQQTSHQTVNMKKLHTIYLVTIFVLVIALIILLTIAYGPGTDQKQKPGPLLMPLLNNVVQNVGVNFESGEPIVIDSLTGEEIAPCRQSDGQNTGKNDQKSETTCKTELKLINGVYQLIDVKTQKLIPSRIVEVVFVLWEGSSWNTTFVGGDQYETGQTIEEKCSMLELLGVLDNPIYANDPIYAEDIQKCQQLR